MLRQHFLLGRQDNVRGFLVHFFFHQRNGDARQVTTKRLKSFEKCAVDRTEETRNSLYVQDVDQLVDNTGGYSGTKRLIGQLCQC